MKQVIIADDGMTVTNVIKPPEDESGKPVPMACDGPALMLDDDAYVGPGMLWDQSADQPLFTWAQDLAQESSGLWSKVKSAFGLGA